MGILGLVEGIMYLTKSDEEFVSTYVVNKKEMALTILKVY